MATVGFLGFAIRPIGGGHQPHRERFVRRLLKLRAYGRRPLRLMGPAAFEAGIARRLYPSSESSWVTSPEAWPWPPSPRRPLSRRSAAPPRDRGTFAAAAIPEMDRYSYSKKLSTGIVAVVGTLGVSSRPAFSSSCGGRHRAVYRQALSRRHLPRFLIAFFFLAVIYGWCKLNPG